MAQSNRYRNKENEQKARWLEALTPETRLLPCSCQDNRDPESGIIPVHYAVSKPSNVVISYEKQESRANETGKDAKRSSRDDHKA